MTVPLLAAALVALPVASLLWTILSTDRGELRAVQENLSRGLTAAPAAEQKRGLAGSLESLGRRLTPPS